MYHLRIPFFTKGSARPISFAARFLRDDFKEQASLE